MELQPLREPSTALSTIDAVTEPSTVLHRSDTSYIQRSFTAAQRRYAHHPGSTAPPATAASTSNHAASTRDRLQVSLSSAAGPSVNVPPSIGDQRIDDHAQKIDDHTTTYEGESWWDDYEQFLGGEEGTEGTPAGRRGWRRIFQRPALAILRNAALKAEPAQTRARRKASQHCLAAETLLHNLTQPLKGWMHSLPVMPKSAIKYSNALMVLLTKKAGLGAAYGFGYGFIIVKLKQTGCLAQWSAPLFFRTQFLSLGLTVGYVHTGLVQAAGQPSQLLHVLAPHKGAGPKVIVDRAWVMEYSDSAQQFRSRGHGHAGARLTSAPHGPSSGTYYIQGGAIMDLSLRVGAHWVPDQYLNAALYGPTTTHADVLSGAVAPLPEFMSLYQLLNSLAMESPM